MTKTKYKNVKTAVNGIIFDSKKEATRYLYLLDKLKAGEIQSLKLQPQFTLQEGFKTPTGEPVRSLIYKADFEYYRPATDDDPYINLTNGGYVRVVEDVKGGAATQTSEFKLKQKLFLAKYGFPITIV